MGRHQRSTSFSDIDEAQASSVLSQLLHENNVLVGASSIGKGLKKACKQHLKDQSKKELPEFLKLPGAQALEEVPFPVEEAFYIVDLGILVSQVYQWRLMLPRVEPFYAVKCNPDPVIVKTLALLGCNFDCASRTEIQLVKQASADLPRSKPEIIYANPCKGRAHVIEALCHGVRRVTVDNVMEIQKLAGISKQIELILRIITDDRGSRCRFSSKFGAPKFKWRPLLSAAKKGGLKVVGVSFHVGSGCRDATRYEDALADARELFDLAKEEFGFDMKLVDIGGGFPGETHSIWNPITELDDEEEDDAEDEKEGVANDKDGKDEEEDRFMYFSEIAEAINPCLDRLFPAESGVRIIGEPGRYMVAAAATLCCSVVSVRANEVDAKYEPEPIMDQEAARTLDNMTREDERQIVRQRAGSVSGYDMEGDAVLTTIQEELENYTKLFASQQLAQQEVDVYNDALDLQKEGLDTAHDLLGPPDEIQQKKQYHTAEGMTYPLVAGELGDENAESTALMTLAAAGEAAVKGVVLQAVADSAPLQDDFAYYINDGVYGAFNNIMFDHATIRPRVLRNVDVHPDAGSRSSSFNSDSDKEEGRELYASTVFGPTCDSIDVIARSVLLPKLKVGDWMYFQNMGAYTMAAASAFNGFHPSERVYVCSVMPEYFEKIIAGPDEEAVAALQAA